MQNIKNTERSRRLDTVTRVVAAVGVLAGMTLSLAACNTTAGVGKDVSATGDAVTNSADKVKQGL